MAALEQITRYHAEVMVGDLLHMQSRVLKISRKTLRFLHNLRNCETDAEVSTSERVATHIDRNSRRSCPLPDIGHHRCRELFSITITDRA